MPSDILAGFQSQPSTGPETIDDAAQRAANTFTDAAGKTLLQLVQVYVGLWQQMWGAKTRESVTVPPQSVSDKLGDGAASAFSYFDTFGKFLTACLTQAWAAGGMSSADITAKLKTTLPGVPVGYTVDSDPATGKVTITYTTPG